jgi:flagellar hook-basal body complex protein FliE
MMKNDKKSKWRLLKLLLVLPLIGGLLWAFSEPVYAYRSNPESINDTSVQDEKEAFTLKGLVVVLDTVPVKNSKTGLFETKVIEEPLTAAAIILKGTKIGTVSATDGSFALPVEVGNEIVVSFVGYETKSIKITNTKDIYVIMNKSSIELEASQVVSKSKNSGVKSPKDGKEVFYIVEDMPSYKGGEGTFAKKLQKKIDSAKKNEQLTGKVKVQFIVDKNGQLQNIKAISRTSEKEAKYAIRFIAELNEWYPGKQRGKAVDCQLVIPVEFN